MKMPNNEKRALLVGATLWVILITYFTIKML
jgi:hypothetical protein